MRKTKRNNKAKRNPYTKPEKSIFLAPPHYEQQEVRSIRVRCLLANQPAVEQILTATQVCSLTGVTATSTTAGVFLSSSFRLKRVCIWGPVATAGTSVTVQLKYSDIPGATGGMVSSPKSVSDTSVSFDRPAYACLTPERDGYFDNWLQCNNGSNMLEITGPLGSTLDFHLQFFVDDIGIPVASRVLVAAVLGTFYRLTAITAGGTQFVPVNPINTV